MKLSEAIFLGRHLCTPQAAPVGAESCNDNVGCALTMASLAVGRKTDGAANAWQQAKEQWPWLGRELPFETQCPAAHCPFGGFIDDNEELVFHLFDYHVFEPLPGYSKWTLEQLVDYVRSIEPDEQPCAALRPAEEKELVAA
jgi:hypothetical protein